MIVGLVGFASSGKDTAAQFLVEEFDFFPIAFADGIKDCLASIFCWDRELLEGKTSESRFWREQRDRWWADRLDIPQFSPRWAMTNFGTDIMRRHLNEDIWIMNTMRRLSMKTDRHIVVKDCRFSNEIRALRETGKAHIVRVKRGPNPEWFDLGGRAAAGDPDATKQMNEYWRVHESEWAWINSDIDYEVCNDGSLEDLRESVRSAISTYA